MFSHFYNIVNPTVFPKPYVMPTPKYTGTMCNMNTPSSYNCTSCPKSTSYTPFSGFGSTAKTTSSISTNASILQDKYDGYITSKKKQDTVVSFPQTSTSGGPIDMVVSSTIDDGITVNICMYVKSDSHDDVFISDMNLPEKECVNAIMVTEGENKFTMVNISQHFDTTSNSLKSMIALSGSPPEHSEFMIIASYKVFNHSPKEKIDIPSGSHFCRK